MIAMLLQQAGTIESAPLVREEIATPTSGVREVRLRVSCCGVCRTDLHIIEGALPPAALPLIPGHQIVGTVDAVGPGCRMFKVGDRIGVAWLRHTCGQCRFCTTGRENLCESSRYTGYHAAGGYAEYAVVPEDFAYAIPREFSDTEAAPLLCAGIIGYRAMRRCNLQPNTRVALFGFGSSAHMVLQLAVHHGCEVYVISRGATHQQLARDLGAAWAGSDPAQLPHKVQSAILFAPVGALVPPALEALDRGGALAIADIHMSPIPQLDYQKHVFYERDLHSVTANTRDDGRTLLTEAARIQLRPIVQRYALADANRALQDLKQGHIDGTAVLTM